MLGSVRFRTWRPDRVTLLVAAIALLAYAPGCWWGAPHATASDRAQSWGVDDETPLGPLAEMHNIIQPKPDRNLGYPLFFSFVTTAVYSPYLLALKASGGLGEMKAVYPFGLSDPPAVLRTLSRLAHATTVVFAVLAVLAALDIGRTLWGTAPGVLGAVFALTLYPMFYYGRTGNVDVPMLSLMALTLAALVRAVVHGVTMRRALLVGVLAGLTLATKEAAAGALLPAAGVILVLGWRAGGAKVPLAALGAAFVAVGLGSGLFVDPRRWVDHVLFIAGRVQDVPSATTLTSAYPFTAAGHAAFVAAMFQRLVETLTLPGLLLAGVGAVVASLRDRRAALFALAVPAYVVSVFLLLRTAQLRYVLPAAFMLAPFAGWAVVQAWRSGRPWLRAAAVIPGTAAVLLQLAHAGALTFEMLRDSRYAAASWLAARVQPGDTVEFFGAANKLPPMAPGVVTVRATPFRGMWGVHDTTEATRDSILERWARRPPKLVIVIPDHSSRPGVPYDISMPPSLYRRLIAGETGLRLAALIQTPAPLPWPRRPPLDYPSVNPPIRIFAP